METVSRTALGFSLVLAAGIFGGTLACSEDSGAETGGTGGLASGGTGTGGVGSGTGGMSTGGTDAGAHTTFYVEGRDLYDRCGQKVVLRGVNEMIVWSAGKDGDPEFSEIAKTGANVVRIVWNNTGSAAELDVAIANALAQKLIPMVENHDATGDLTKLNDAVSYWLQDDVLAVLKKYEQDLLLNLANESGDGTVTAPQFQTAYETQIARVRDAGLVLPLVIDAPNWGSNIDVIQATFAALQTADVRKNLLFSVHMYWNDPEGTKVVSEIAESVTLGMPLIVGEFAQHAVYLCDESPFDYPTLLDEAEKNGIGWLAWSWGGGSTTVTAPIRAPST